MSLSEPNPLDVAQMPAAGASRKINVLLVTSVALSFISFWRAAAIVLCDLASTAYYIGGISEQAIGKAAPWFILGVMLFSYAVRSVYVESCTMFTRGGVYKVVKGALGGNLAKLSVSALMFDYILTGPISAVAASDYLVGLFGDMLKLMTGSAGLFDGTIHKVFVPVMVVIVSVAVTFYFWRLNIIGIHESSDKALRIMQLTTIMGVLIVGWSILTMVLHHTHIEAPPLHPVFTGTSKDPLRQESSAGWLEAFPKLLGMMGILVAFGHSLLAMSGEESLAQVNREIQAPKLKNLLRAGFVIFLYSLLLTSLVSFLAVFIIPDGMRVQTEVVNNGVDVRDGSKQDAGWWEVDYLRHADATHAGNWGYVIDRTTDAQQTVKLAKTQHVERDDGGYRDNLINGLVQNLAGPKPLKIVMEIFVVVVGFLILSGAVNTSIVGSNGVLNRLAEDGVLTPWFQHPHKRFGTTHRLINTVGIMQIVVIIGSLGNVNTLGEAYAFGVIWSFVFMTMSMTVLRFKDKRHREYEVPLNVRTKTKDGRRSFWCC
jgi:amino acid transporter